MPRGEVIEYVLSVFGPVKTQVPDIGIGWIMTALVAQPVIGVVNVIGQMVHASTVCFLYLVVKSYDYLDGCLWPVSDRQFRKGHIQSCMVGNRPKAAALIHNTISIIFF